MAHSSWGGPGCSRAMLDIVVCPGIQLNIRKEVAPIFRELVRWLTEERRKHGASPLSSSGGYIKRYISGTTTWSNHSWGLAADFNAGTNPYQHTFRSDMPPGTSAKAASLGLRWGGDYGGRKDPMHFEFVGSRDDAARIVAALAHTHTPPPPPPPVKVLNPTEEKIMWPIVREGSKGQSARNVQGLLCAAGRTVAIDGDFGPASARTLKAWQNAAGLVADGVCGDKSYRTFLGI